MYERKRENECELMKIDGARKSIETAFEAFITRIKESKETFYEINNKKYESFESAIEIELFCVYKHTL